MLKRLAKQGNSLALVIDRGVLDILDIDAETLLSVTTEAEFERMVRQVAEGQSKKERIAVFF